MKYVPLNHNAEKFLLLDPKLTNSSIKAETTSNEKLSGIVNYSTLNTLA